MELQDIILAVGYLGLFFIIFSESGLLIGVFFPGDSLLFTAGFLASQGYFDIRLLAPLCFAAAVLGDNVGYTFGHRLGKRLFTREDSFFFHRDNVARAQDFYGRHGGKTIILARFVPAVRTLAPILAGVGDMHYPTFLAYNLVGGALWAVGLTSLGYVLGSFIPGVDRYLLPLVLLVVVASLVPYGVGLLRSRERRRSLRETMRRVWRQWRSRP